VRWPGFSQDDISVLFSDKGSTREFAHEKQTKLPEGAVKHKGSFAFEIGDEKFQRNTGDTVFAPRNVPHGWAHIDDEPGTLLTIVWPAGSFEAFLLETTRHAHLPPPEEVEKAFAAHDMKVVGPPLDVTHTESKSKR
jgi:hypothetical protein